MDRWLASHRCARMMSTAMTLIFEATEHAREAGRLEISSQLEYLTEELIELHRKALDLPPKLSPPADEPQDTPFF